MDIYSHARATLRDDSYFASFVDAGHFRCYRDGEAPVDSGLPFIEIEIDDGDAQIGTGWATPVVTFTVYGKITQWELLNDVCEQIAAIFLGRECFVALGEDAPVQYSIVDRIVFSRGKDPVTEYASRSVALTFGVVW